MASPISAIGKSLIRHAVDLVTEINATTPHQVQYWAWETRAEEDKLPKETLFGLDNFAFSERQGLWEITCGFGLSTYEDPNLLNELDLLDILFDRCHEGQKITLLDPIDGSEIDQLVISDFELSPMVQSMFRNYRTLNVTLLRTSTALG